MSCEHGTEIDLAAFVADPRDPAFASFRSHVAGCEHCAPEVADWLALRAELTTLEGSAHPAPEALLAIAEGRADASAEAHLAECAACRSELRVLREFEVPAAVRSAAPAEASWLDRLREAITGGWPAPALAAAALVLLGWFVWSAIPESPERVTVAETEAVPASPRIEEFGAASPGEPETVVRAEADAAALPDDAPVFDESRPTEIGFNDTGYPGFSGDELAGMPEPSLALEPLELGEPLAQIAIADPLAEPTPESLAASDAEAVVIAEETASLEAEPAASPTAPEVEPAPAPIQIAALLPSELPRYLPNAALAGGSLEPLRIGSGVRGGGDGGPRLQAMAPDHVAPVATDTPALHWWLSGRSDDPVELTLVVRESGATLLERRVEPPVRAGLHPFSLGGQGVSLPRGAIVEWYVARVVDDGRRELDVVSNAALRFVPRTGTSAPGHEAHDLAGSGYWIDAFAQLSRWIEAEPEAVALRTQRAELARQAGLEAP